MKRVLYVTFVLWAIHANAQTDNINYYEVDESLPVIEIQTIGGGCDRLRDDVNEMLPTFQEELLDCIMTYLNSGNNEDWVEGVDPLWEKNFIVLEHYNNLDEWHNREEVGFFTGHREYLEGLEAYLLESPGCEIFVPLPAFNPSDGAGGIPDLFFDENAVLDGFEQGIDEDGNSGDLLAPFDEQFPNLNQLQVTEQTCNQFGGDIDNFATYIEAGFNQHNAVHGEIGGVMGIPAISPSSAIFWLWHAYVDDTYRCYQELCQNCQPTANQKDCTVCFDLPENGTELSFFDAAGNPMNIVLDSKGCVSKNLSEGGLLGENIQIVVDGDNCSRDHDFTTTIQMPTSPIGVDPKWGKSCVDLVPNPRSPFSGGIFEMSLENLGEREEVSVTHIDFMTGEEEVLLSTRYLDAGQKYMLRYNASKWQSGRHVIQITYGNHRIVDQVIKL